MTKVNTSHEMTRVCWGVSTCCGSQHVGG